MKTATLLVYLYVDIAFWMSVNKVSILKLPCFFKLILLFFGSTSTTCSWDYFFFPVLDESRHHVVLRRLFKCTNFAVQVTLHLCIFFMQSIKSNIFMFRLKHWTYNYFLILLPCVFFQWVIWLLPLFLHADQCPVLRQLGHKPCLVQPGISHLPSDLLLHVAVLLHALPSHKQESTIPPQPPLH